MFLLPHCLMFYHQVGSGFVHISRTTEPERSDGGPLGEPEDIMTEPGLRGSLTLPGPGRG